MTSPRYTTVSLFAGAGGLDVGLHAAGFLTTHAVEADDNCVGVLRRAAMNDAGGVLTLDDTRIIRDRVEHVGVDNLRQPDGRRLDLLTGGPPCQPFSSAGKQRSVAESRGRLFEPFAQLAELLSPRMVLLENVRGLLTAVGDDGRAGGALRLLKHAFESRGFATAFGLLNAADYGCPQRRVRVFMLASRDVPLPAFPQQTHDDAEAVGMRRAMGLSDRLPWVTLGDFLAGRPEPDAADVVRPTKALAAKLKDVPAGRGLRSAGARETTRPGGHWGYRQGTFVADTSLPARTVTGSSGQDWLRAGDGLRRLTWRECAALQGFPADWPFDAVASKAARFRMIGNAVPAPLGEAMGRVIAAALRDDDERRAARDAGGLAAVVPAVLPVSVPLGVEFIKAAAGAERERAKNGAARTRARGDHRHKSDGMDGGPAAVVPPTAEPADVASPPPA